MVRKGGLEPPHLSVPDPKSGASANSATFAKSITYRHRVWCKFSNIVMRCFLRKNTNSLPIAFEHLGRLFSPCIYRLLSLITACCSCGYQSVGRLHDNDDGGDGDADPCCHLDCSPGCSSCLDHSSAGLHLSSDTGGPGPSSGYHACYCYSDQTPHRREIERT